MGVRLRRRREELGLTVRDVAVLAGLRSTSAAYVSQLESGARTPRASLAQRLAEALHDDPRIYLAWAATSRRADPFETARAVRILADLLRHPICAASSSAGEDSPPGERASAAVPFAPQAAPTRQALPAIGPRGAGAAVPAAKLLVPEFEEDADPAHSPPTGPRVLALHRIDPDTLSAVEPLVQPFAYRLSESGVRRVRDVVRPQEVVLLTRRCWPIRPGAPCAVRLAGHVVLARLLWNERQLLLLPSPGESDFIVLDAPDRPTLERLVAGRAVATLRTQG